MTDYIIRIAGWWRGAVVVLALAGTAGCAAATTTAIPADVAQPDQFLMERGTESLERRRWQDAREYFRQVVDNYPQSAYRPDAKLGLGEAYMGEGGTEALLRAANEYSEFLRFFPTHPRADYAQYQLAMTYHRQMRAVGRDQTETREALKQFEAFFDRFPNSPLTPEVREKWREARDRLSEDGFRVGLHYFRLHRGHPGAIDRFREVLRDDPQFTRRDAVYYHLAESLAASGRTAEALPYYQRLLTEFEESEYLADARRRLDDLQ